MKKLIVFITFLIFVNTLNGVSCNLNRDNKGSTDSAPPIITWITVSDITETSATISWTTSEPATGNLVYGLTTSYGSSFPAEADTTADKTVHSLEISGLTSDTTYHYQVKSKDVAGNEGISDDKTFTTLTPPDITPPTISEVSATDITVNSVTIKWTTNEPATSQVEYGENSGYGLNIPLDGNLVTSHSVTLSGLEPGTAYHFRVKSKDTSDNLSISVDTSFSTTADTTSPAIPFGLTATSGYKTIELWWGANTETDLDGYIIYRSDAADGTFERKASSPITGNAYADSGLQNDATHYYRISAIDRYGNESDMSDIVSASTDITLVGPLSGTISTASVLTSANSPYIITGNVVIDTATRLTIEPGVSLKFDGYFRLTVRGTLVAKGTESEMIRLTSNKASPHEGDWDLVFLDNLSRNCSFKYTVFEYASAAIHFGGNYQSQTIIENSIFRNNHTALSYLQNAVVSHSLFEDNWTAIYAAGSGAGSVVHYNTIRDSSYAFDISGVAQDIQWNNFINISERFVTVNTTWAINMANNWWGTTDTSFIDERIRDYMDDSILGRANYLPIAAAPIPDAP